MRVKGGARSRSGPPPDPNALARERDQGEWRKLPAEGRQSPPPPWPLIKPTKRELFLWAREWTRPQAVVWEENGQNEEVAMYVRTFVVAELPFALANIRTLLRQQMDALGLTIPGLLRNRWTITGEAAAMPVVPQGSEPSVRDRLRVVGE